MAEHSALNVVILAAGKGTRMYSDLPKVLHEIAGRPMLQHVVDTVSTLGPQKICVVYGFGGEQVRQRIVGNSLLWVEQAEQLGTGHAVQQALPQLDEQALTLVVYGDVPLINAETLASLVASAAATGISVLTAEFDDPTGYGRIVRDRRGDIVKIVEQKDATAQELGLKEGNTGILAAKTTSLKRWLGTLKNDNAQGEYYLTDVVAAAVNEGCRVASCQAPMLDEISGVNNKAQLAELERSYQLAHARKLLLQGVTLRDPGRLDVRGTLHCGKDVVIDVNAVFSGMVTLADGVQIGPHCVLNNVSVGRGTRIEAYCHIDDATIGEACKIGPFARIRPGTSLERDAHVGNFVEIKNSRVGAQSKVNHLSYVGDTTMGARVNVGAGTITCNYDGANKHRTVIEDDVFIGSDTQLIAPVTVERGATIGAGTTLTQTAAAEQLTLSRAKQITISGWKRPTKKT